MRILVFVIYGRGLQFRGLPRLLMGVARLAVFLAQLALFSSFFFVGSGVSEDSILGRFLIDRCVSSYHREKCNRMTAKRPSPSSSSSSSSSPSSLPLGPLLLLLLLILAALLHGCHGEEGACENRQSYMNCLDRLNRVAPNNIPPSPCTLDPSRVRYVAKGSKNVYVSCNVTQHVSIQFHGWYHYPSNGSSGSLGDLLPIDTSDRLSEDTDRLTIDPVMPEDEGVYACDVTETPDGEDMGVRKFVFAGCIIVYATVPSYDGTTRQITTDPQKNVTLDTTVIFEDSGYCNVTPSYNLIRLRFNMTRNIFQCDSVQHCEISNSSVSYSHLKDVVLGGGTYKAGPYAMALVESCSSNPNNVLRRDFNITLLSSGTNTLYPIGGTKSTSVQPSQPSQTVAGPASSTVSPTRDPELESSVITGVIAGVTILVVVIILIVIVVVIITLILVLQAGRRRPKTTAKMSIISKEPFYEVPTHVLNSNGRFITPDGRQLTREDSLYSGQYPPSTIGGYKNGGGGGGGGGGPYDYSGGDVELHDKPSDQVANL